jgi:hypothetical protein
MYVTFRRYKIDPANTEEILKRVNEGFAPFLYNAVGFVSYEIFCDEEGYICSVSMFNTRASMEEANASAAEWVAKNIRQLLPNPPLVSQGESLLERRRLERLY